MPSDINDRKVLERLVGEAAAKDIVVITTRWNAADASHGTTVENELRDAQEFFANKLSVDYPITHLYPKVNYASVLQSITQQSVSLNEHSDFIL
jgi:hypothetical protein